MNYSDAAIFNEAKNFIQKTSSKSSYINVPPNIVPNSSTLIQPHDKGQPSLFVNSVPQLFAQSNCQPMRGNAFQGQQMPSTVQRQDSQYMFPGNSHSYNSGNFSVNQGNLNSQFPINNSFCRVITSANSQKDQNASMSNVQNFGNLPQVFKSNRICVFHISRY